MRFGGFLGTLSIVPRGELEAAVELGLLSGWKDDGSCIQGEGIDAMCPVKPLCYSVQVYSSAC